MPSVNQQKGGVQVKKVKSTIEEDLWGSPLHRTVAWGLPGTGKTTLAATWPAPILWLVCSGTGETAGLGSINTPENRKRITPKMISTTDAFVSISQDRELLAKYAEGTVVLDHIGGYADLHLQEVLGLQEIVVKNWGMASMDEYRLVSDRVKLSLNRLFSCAPGKVVIIGHQKLHENKKNPAASFNGVSCGASVAEWLHKNCDGSFQTFIEQKYKSLTTEGEGDEEVKITTTEKDGVEFRLRLGGDESMATKFQTPKRGIVDFISSPTYDKLKKALGA